MASIGIVGGGIIGSAAASWLIAEGHQVTVYERDPGGKPASGGNAGLIAISQIYPLARAGILRQAPAWLADPLGPLAVRWQDLPAMTPWLLAFAAKATRRAETETMDALAGLSRTTLADHLELGRRARLTGHLRNTGALSVHDTVASLDREAALYEAIRTRLEIDFARITAGAARQLVPELEGPFAGALHFEDFWIVTDPLDVLRHFQQWVSAKATLRDSEVRAVEPGSGGVSVRHGQGSDTHDFVLVAAGIWSRELVRRLGLKVLLETERGYNTTFPSPRVHPRMPIIFADHGFVATPFTSSLRVGGAVELASPDAPPNFARARAMRTRMRRYVPALPEDGGVEWMGRRPSTPDSMPVISRHPGDPRILFAFGHGHMGLTYSATTARLLAAMIRGDEDRETLRPFDIARFQ